MTYSIKPHIPELPLVPLIGMTCISVVETPLEEPKVGFPFSVYVRVKRRLHGWRRQSWLVQTKEASC